MKKNSIILSLLGVLLSWTAGPLAAADCCQPYNNCCEWSFCDGKITAGADWLYWKVLEDNLDIGASEEVSVSLADPLVFPVNINSSHPCKSFKYESGFRVHLGYELPCDCWDIDVAYTYMPSHANIANFHSDSPDNVFFAFDTFEFPLFNSFFLINDLTDVHAKWNLTANNIDVDLGRTVCFGECLKIRPHVGFRSLWFDQKLRVEASSIIPGAPDQTSFALIREKFTGYGVEAGLWAEYQVGCGLSVVGHFGGSILYSKFRNHQEFVSFQLEPTTDLITLNACECIRSSTPTMDYFVGLQYADCICDMLFSAHVGWEQHVLFNVNRLARNGNLSTQGLTVGANVGF